MSTSVTQLQIKLYVELHKAGIHDTSMAFGVRAQILNYWAMGKCNIVCWVNFPHISCMDFTIHLDRKPNYAFKHLMPTVNYGGWPIMFCAAISCNMTFYRTKCTLGWKQSFLVIFPYSRKIMLLYILLTLFISVLMDTLKSIALHSLFNHQI